MPTDTPTTPAINPSLRELATSVVEAIQLWTNPLYTDFLLQDARDSKIGEDWFSRFTKEWRVRRTIDSNRQSELLEYINSEDFRNNICGSEPGHAVDVAADYIQTQGWSAMNKKRGARVKPTSLVSKVAFFIRPKELPPMDSLSKLGLNRTRGTKKANGEGHQDFKSYARYLAEFDLKYTRYQVMLRDTSQAPWAEPLTTALGGELTLLQSEPFLRKAFDNMLMRIGRRTAKDTLI